MAIYTTNEEINANCGLIFHEDSGVRILLNLDCAWAGSRQLVRSQSQLHDRNQEKNDSALGAIQGDVTSLRLGLEQSGSG